MVLSNKQLIQAEDIISRNRAFFDLPFHSHLNTDNGWKISIQGKSTDDSLYLFRKLHEFLLNKDIPFKVATCRRMNYFKNYIIEYEHELEENCQKQKYIKEQSHKAMTIYCPDDFDIINLCEIVKELIPEYDGFVGVDDPTSYTLFSKGIYYRNDRDSEGNYVMPQSRK